MTRVMRSEDISDATLRIRSCVLLENMVYNAGAAPRQEPSGDMNYLADLDVHCRGKQMNSLVSKIMLEARSIPHLFTSSAALCCWLPQIVVNKQTLQLNRKHT